MNYKSNLWICTLLIGYLAICAVAESKSDNKEKPKEVAKDKRQIERQTVTIGGNNSPPRFYNSHSGPLQQEAQDQPAYIAPNSRAGKAAHYRGPPPPQQQQQLQQQQQHQPQQQQLSELPAEYVKLIQELALQQSYPQPGRIPANKAHNLKFNYQQHPQHRPAGTELQYINLQPAAKPEQGIQFITEEEYAKLYDNQKQLEAQQQQQHQHYRPQGPINGEGLGNYRAPQLAKLPPGYSKYPQPVTRPLTDFDKELALLIESNKPVPYEAPQPLPRPSALKQQQQQQQQQQVIQIPQKQHNEQRYQAAAPEQIYAPQHLPQQAVKYPVPANVHYAPNKPAQNTKPRFESNAQRYQVIPYPHQFQIRPDSQDANSHVQYYIPKEKEVLTQQFEDAQHQVLYETQGVMKVVDPPQLQYQPNDPQKHSQSPASKYHASKKQQIQPTNPAPVQEPQRSSGPSRAQIYVSRTTQGPPIPTSDKPKLPPLKIDNSRPLTQEEFQSLVDQGYNLLPIPVPVPYPVHVHGDDNSGDRRPSEEPHPAQSQRQYHSQANRPRHHAPAYRYGQQASASRNLPTYIQPASQDSVYSGVRGPNVASAKK